MGIAARIGKGMALAFETRPSLMQGVAVIVLIEVRDASRSHSPP
jgi:hypothetical protein